MSRCSVVYGLATQISDVIGHGCTQTCLAVKQKGGYNSPYYFGPLYETRELAEKNMESCETIVELVVVQDPYEDEIDG